MVVASGDEALIAARLNVNLQAVVIRRRFSHQSTRDLSSLSEFVDTGVSHDLADHYSPEERARILATSLGKLRPELDLYLMTEIEVEDIAGPAGSVLPPGIPRPGGHARAAPVDPARRRGALPDPVFSALKQYSHRPTGVFHALPISQGKSIVNSHWIKDMVGFYGLEVFMAETRRPVVVSTRCWSPPVRYVNPSSSRRRPMAHGTPTSSPTALRPPTRSSPRRWWPPATSCCSTVTATSHTITA